MRVSVIKRKINVVDLFLFFLEIMNLLIEEDIRVEYDSSDEKLGKKIRQSNIEKY